MLRLQIIAGHQTGQEFTPGQKTISIGRSQESDLTIQESAVSRSHGKLTRTHDRLVYSDSNSHNGSVVHFRKGGSRNLGPLFWEQEVHEGDTIQVGNTKILVKEFNPSTSLSRSALDYTIIGTLAEMRRGRSEEPSVIEDEDLLAGFLNFPGIDLHDEEQVLTAVVQQLQQMLPDADSITALTLSQSANTDRTFAEEDIAHIASNIQRADSPSDGLSYSVLNDTLRRNSPLCFIESALLGSESAILNEMSSCICAPMSSEGGCIGFIQVSTRKSQLKTFGRRDLSLVSVISNVASLLIQQSRAFRREAQLRTFASVGQVVAGMSHDAKNILFSLGAFTKAVERRHPDLTESAPWHQVLDDIDFLRFLVNDTWSRIGSQQGKFAVEDCNLNQLCETVLRRCGRYFLNEQQTDWLQVDNQIPGDLTVEVESQLLSVVLFNCFKNSIDAYRFAEGDSKVDKATLRLRATVEPKSQSVELHILDEAGGIPDSVRQLLGKELVSTKGELGSGLGTRLMLETVDRLGGEVKMATSRHSLDSVPAGTCVTLRIPMISKLNSDAEDPQPPQWILDYHNYRNTILNNVLC